MKTYEVIIDETVSMKFIVEANTPEEAENIAMDAHLQGAKPQDEWVNDRAVEAVDISEVD